MALHVTFHARFLVSIVHVTYKVEYVWSVNMGYMAVIVIYRVPQTVKTTRVTYTMEHALHVDLDGLGYIVQQVILLIISLFFSTCK